MPFIETKYTLLSSTGTLINEEYKRISYGLNSESSSYSKAKVKENILKLLTIESKVDCMSNDEVTLAPMQGAKWAQEIID